MANIFTLILVISTIMTGLLWFLNKFIYIFKQYIYKVKLQHQNNNIYVNSELSNKVRKKLRFVEIGASMFPVLIITLILRSFIYEPFQIPSESMMPTLLSGDFILVEKFIYGIKDPIFQKTFIKVGHPKRGDVIVFKYPKNPHINYIKRVIGLPGDKVIYNPIDKKIIIQPNCGYSVCNDTLPIIYLNFKSKNFLHNVTTTNNSNIILSNEYLYHFVQQQKAVKYYTESQEYEEILGNVAHNIFIIPGIYDHIDLYYHQHGQPLATWIVPPEHYFVMGDNRDNSADSRYWGFVPESNLVGKATVIWMSIKKQTNGWPVGIRLSRIGIIN